MHTHLGLEGRHDQRDAGPQRHWHVLGERHERRVVLLGKQLSRGHKQGLVACCFLFGGERERGQVNQKLPSQKAILFTHTACNLLA